MAYNEKKIQVLNTNILDSKNIVLKPINTEIKELSENKEIKNKQKKGTIIYG